jgi:menaquinone-dependent protoporphyrinogen oxidase
MSASILVTYATRYGSTQEVAEAVAQTLSESSIEVALLPASEVTTLAIFDAVVLGAPLYIGKWHKDAHRFLNRFRSDLQGKPLAIFSLGPTSTSEDEMIDCRGQLDRDLSQYDWLNPVAVEMFVGKYDPDKLNFAHKLLTIPPASPLHDRPATDHRDWDAIREWASALAVQLSDTNVKGEPDRRAK